MAEIRLLSIEDDKRISHLIGKVSSEMGFSVCIANNKKEIVQLYRNFKPQIVILDILMPEMDGFEVLQFLGRRKSKAQIIILSGSKYNQIAQNMAKALNLNIVANLSKPFRIETLRLVLDEIRYSIEQPGKKIKSNQAF